MIKQRDVPRELKELTRKLSEFARDGYRYDMGELFLDLIDYGLEAFKIKTNPEVMQRLSSRYGEQLSGLHEIFAELLQTMAASQGEGWTWFDALGQIYEIIASNYKKSALG